MSQDPIGFTGGDVNLYRYVGSYPVARSDPSGLQERKPATLPGKLPSDFPIDMRDKSLDETKALRTYLWWIGVQESVRNQIYGYGCGALASYRFGNVMPAEKSHGRAYRLLFPGSSRPDEPLTRDGKTIYTSIPTEAYWFPSFQSAAQAADELVKNGKQVRIMLYQSTNKPMTADDDYQPRFDYQYDPIKLPGGGIVSQGVFNFATMHWDSKKCNYYFEYVNDGGTDKYRAVSPGNIPEFMHGIRVYNYWMVIVITPQMKRESIGLPRVPWKE